MMKKRLGQLGRDPLFQRLTKNVGVLLTGSFAGSLIGIVTTGLIVKSVGPGFFGLMALAQSYALIIDGVLNFQSWEAVIKIGAERRGQERPFDDILRVGLLVDIASAVAAFLIAFFGLDLLIDLFGWEAEVRPIFRIFALSIITNIQGTPVGILRLYDRFHVFAVRRVSFAVFKLAVVFVLFFSDSPNVYYAYTIVGTQILERLAIIWAAHFTMLKNGFSRWFVGPLRSWREVMGFAFWSNVTRTVALPSREFDKFIVATLSIELVGAYKLLKQIGSMVKKVSTPFFQAIYPEFASLVSAGNYKRAHRVMVKIGTAIAGASALPVLAVVLLSDYWIPALLGTEYVVYRNVFAAYLVWQAFIASLVTVDPLFVAAGHVRSKFFITAASNVAYIFMAIPLVSMLGLWGIVIAAVAQGCLILVPKLIVLGRKNT